MKIQQNMLVWYDIVSSVETFLFRPRIYLFWVWGALEALQCIICHYLRTELRNYVGRPDQAFYYNRFISFRNEKEMLAAECL